MPIRVPSFRPEIAFLWSNLDVQATSFYGSLSFHAIPFNKQAPTHLSLRSSSHDTRNMAFSAPSCLSRPPHQPLIFPFT